MLFYLPYVSMGGYSGCWFFLVTVYRYISNGGTDWHDTLHDGTYRFRVDLLLLWGNTPSDPQIRNIGPKFGPFDCEYLGNGKFQHYMSIRA